MSASPGVFVVTMVLIESMMSLFLGSTKVQCTVSCTARVNV